MKVVVENLTGTLFYVEVSNDAIVGDLRKEIEAQQNLPADRLLLVSDADKGLIMSKEEEKVPLLDLGIQDGSHIYLFFTPVVDDNSNDNFRSNCPDFHIA